MEHRSGRREAAALWIAALLGAGCAQPQITTEPASAGRGGPGAAPGAGPAAPPVFTLPDGGQSPVTADASSAPRACAEEAHRAEIVSLDLLLLVDASGSMDQPAGAM